MWANRIIFQQTETFITNWNKLHIKFTALRNTAWCKKTLPLFKFPALAAAWQTDQPMHSQSANFGKFKLNSLNLAAFFSLYPVVISNMGPTKMVLKQICKVHKFIAVDIKNVGSPFRNLKLHILTNFTLNWWPPLLLWCYRGNPTFFYHCKLQLSSHCKYFACKEK